MVGTGQPPQPGDRISDTVQTDSGLIRGTEHDGVKVFLGIPYAAPPVGDLRWRPPRPVTPWEGIKDTTRFGNTCPQKPLSTYGFSGMMYMEEYPGTPDEDCLYLNVWTPAVSRKEKLPVMVWIYGGGFIAGSSAEPRYNGSSLARQGVVVVTHNYRVGPIGFLAHPALSAESPTGTSGNYGLMDQIAALRWVQKNIDKFGGDPDKVTIFGQSAGSISVTSLMASPLTPGLFSRSIAESGAPPSKIRDRTRQIGNLSSMESQGVVLAQRLGIPENADTARALRAKSWQEITNAYLGNSWGGPGENVQETLSVDGYVLTEQPTAVFQAGREANVPFIAGTVHDEGSVYAHDMGINTTAKYYGILQSELGSNASRQVLALYPADNDSAVEPAVSQMLGDGIVAAVRDTARAHARIQPDTYLYQFTQESAKGRANGMGVFHTTELPFVFNTPASAGGFSEADATLSREVRDYWVNFARTGDPNGRNLYRWPRYNATSDTNLVLGTPVSTEQYLRKQECDFFDSLSG